MGYPMSEYGYLYEIMGCSVWALQVFIFGVPDVGNMEGKTNFNAPIHKQQSMIHVNINTPGVKMIRPLMVFRFDDAPHGYAEMSFENVRVLAKNILLVEGRDFEIAQENLRLISDTISYGGIREGME